MLKTVFNVSKMDCPSEEKLIRMALNGEETIKFLEFDLSGRLLTAFHQTDPETILQKLKPLNFGATMLSNQPLTEAEARLIERDNGRLEGREAEEAKVLKVLLAINAGMFLFEIVLGFIAQSTGLIADAMDMFADAAVYGVSLFAVGKALAIQRKAARLSGFAQMILATVALIEIGRRFYYGSEPESSLMMIVSFIALLANVICLILISRHRDSGVHMKASAIFSANDVIANAGVISAGFLVYIFDSSIPDLLIGLLISAVVFRGSISIMKIARDSA